MEVWGIEDQRQPRYVQYTVRGGGGGGDGEEEAKMGVMGEGGQGQGRVSARVRSVFVCAAALLYSEQHV